MYSLSVTNICKAYKKRVVVNNVSFEIKQGEIVGLLGPNGAGKTTSFYISVGLVKPNSGDVYCNDENVTKFPMHKRAKLGVGYLPQEASIFRKMTVEHNISSILETRRLSRFQMRRRCVELLREFNVYNIRKQLGYTLSGGERRRVEIARALASNPKILLLDEPFAGVDPIAVKDIQLMIKKIQTMNIGILITDHNVRETLKIASRAYLIADGRVFSPRQI